MSEEERVVPGEIGLGSRVRFQIPPRADGRDGFMSGLSGGKVNGLTGTVVRADGRSDHEFTVRLDSQDGAHGWRGEEGYRGDPSDYGAYCYYMGSAGLVLISSDPEPETPEPNPEESDILEFKKKIYAKAIELTRTDYSGYERQVQAWLAEVNMAPSAATYRISGELKYRAGRYGSGVPSVESILRDRLSSLPDVKVEVVDMTFPAPKPGETVETLTADMFALVERVVTRGDVCAEARVFIRKLGLRRPPRKSAKVELDLKLNAAELAALGRDGVAGLLALMRDREAAAERVTGVRVVEERPAVKRASRKTTKAATTPTVGAEPAIKEPAVA